MSSINDSLFLCSCEETKRKLLDVCKALKDPKTTVNYSKLASDEIRRMSSRKGAMFENKMKKLQASDQRMTVFRALVEWRDQISKIIDDKPELSVSSFKILDLTISDNSSITRVKEILGDIDKRISDPASMEPQQAGVIMKIIETGGQYMDEIRNLECHNCLKTGHGPVWACPFPKEKGIYKAYYQNPEHQQFRDKQYMRRWGKLVAKVGEQKAREVVEKTKRKRTELDKPHLSN